MHIEIAGQIKSQHVGNKIKGWISNRVFQENKARQIFRKTNISYPLIRTRTCVYPEKRTFLTRWFRFSKNLVCFVFLKHPFSDSPFCLNVDEHMMVHGIHAIRYYSKTKFKMKCIVCSKLTVEIAQHYQWLCRYVSVIHFEQTIPANLYLFKVNGRRLDKGV